MMSRPYHVLAILSRHTGLVPAYGSIFVVSGISNVEKCRDLEIGVRGHSRSLKVVLFDRLCVTISNHWPISHRFRYKRRFPSKIAKFFPPRVYIAPAEGVILGIRYRRRGHSKLR